MYRDQAVVRSVVVLLGAMSIMMFVSIAGADAALPDSSWGVVSSMENVFPESRSQDYDLARDIRLTIAQGESQSVQIAFFAGDKPVRIDSVKVSPLSLAGSDKSIPAGAVDIRRVGYVKVNKFSWRGIKRKGYWPDPLLAFKSFVCPKNSARSLWLTLHVPRGQAAGVYHGKITVKCGDATVELPVGIRVCNFALPKLPLLNTSYWANFGYCYHWQKEAPIYEKAYKMFGAYRTSTTVMGPKWADWYREKDGTITCDPAGMKKAILTAVEAGFATLNAGRFCETHHLFDPLTLPIRDRESGKLISKETRETIAPETLAKAYLNTIVDWLEEQGLLERSYIELDEEQSDWKKWPEIIKRHETYRKIEPRIRYLGLVGIHPDLQGVFDIWAPHQSFYDKNTYEMVEKGISLAATKDVACTVTASSTGGWGNGSFYKYRPSDAYDGCVYTKWTPGRKPTKDNPEWLLFSFHDEPKIFGIKLVPYGQIRPSRGLIIEGSENGKEFTKLTLTPRGINKYQIPTKKYKALRVKFISASVFKPTKHQPLPAPELCYDGIREIEFVVADKASKKTAAREKRRPSEMWEYAVGADYPSVCVDASPYEIRAIGVKSWRRGVKGYLNYGAAQWQMPEMKRPKDEDPLFWPEIAKPIPNGSNMIVYPGKDEVLPSVRFARFRDGLQDYDYLCLLERMAPRHQLLKAIRSDNSGDAVVKRREQIILALDKLAQQTD